MFQQVDVDEEYEEEEEPEEGDDEGKSLTPYYEGFYGDSADICNHN